MTGVAAPTGSHVLRSPSEATHRDFARKQHQDLGIGWDPKDSTGGAWPGKRYTGSHEAESWQTAMETAKEGRTVAEQLTLARRHMTMFKQREDVRQMLTVRGQKSLEMRTQNHPTATAAKETLTAGR